MNLGGRGAWAATVVACALLATGCSSSAPNSESSPSVEPTSALTPTPRPTPPPDTDGDGVLDSMDDFPDDPTRTKQLYYASGDPVVVGYPLVVDTAQLDYRLANWIKTPQAVALAPGVYAGYNPAVADLAVYLEANTGDGDCAVREMYQFGGGACWDGVLASPAEPTQ
ncbi:hypothetical protein [Microbacterium paraoxydans]|nr:hypothetical protein [Microbacterium paraoxydans]